MNTNRDILKALARCRVFDLNQAIKYLHVNEKELDLLCEEKILSKEYNKTDLNVMICYYLTGKGEQYVRQNLPEIREFYRGFILEHDLRLTEFYLELSPEEQASWLTRDDLIKQFKLSGAVDGAYINTSREFEGIEIMNKTGKPSTLEKTENFVAQSGIKRMNYILY